MEPVSSGKNPGVDYSSAYAEAGQAINRETVRERALRLLATLVPSFQNKDVALGHLFYIHPELGENRLWAIAAALYVLAEPDPENEAEEKPLRAALERARTDLQAAESWLRASGTVAPMKIQKLHDAQIRITQALGEKPMTHRKRAI